MNRVWVYLFICLFCFFQKIGLGAVSATSTAQSHLQIPKIFGDHMVLQREIKIPLWGKSLPGEKITAQLGEHNSSTKADKNGEWKLTLNPMPSGGPYTLSVYNKETVQYKDILIGEVWVASGQSNMEMPIGGWAKILGYEKVLQEANEPDIRFLVVNRSISPTPMDNIETRGWHSCVSTNIEYYSAVSYFFAKELHEKLKCPVGIIQSPWGGTKIQTWTSPEGVKNIPELVARLASMDAIPGNISIAQTEYGAKTADWFQNITLKDTGNHEDIWIWNNSNLDDSQWKTMELPQLWEHAGQPGFDGVIWFRKDIQIPESWAGKDVLLSLGPVDDQDITWLNGIEVGRNQWFATDRQYTVPGNLVQAGKNQITIRVFDTGGDGGFNSKPEKLKIILLSPDETSDTTISLAGDWKYSVGLDMKTVRPIPGNPFYPLWPTCIYNGMISPLIPYAIRGVIWYQGESDTSEAYLYRRMFPNMIQDWRNHWGQGDFPFLYVQLANFKERKPEPADDDWAELREAQLMTLNKPNTRMAVAIDIGDAKDIHPKNKQDVGHRLALQAKNLVYGEDIVSSGPMYESMKVEGNKIRIKFTNIGSGLIIKENTVLKGFSIAGTDHKYYWADATIEGDTVVVSSPRVSHPLAVRYGWDANPDCNLYNREGLPASPFRTDTWRGITQY